MRFLPRRVACLVLACSTLGLSSCSPSSNDESRGDEAVGVESAAPARAPEGPVTAANVLENERYWPDIVALTKPWTPPGSAQALKQGYRGALIRVDEQGRARIAFGRHGNHDIPIESTDLITRANEVASRERHKVAPNFLAQFGTQFLHPSTEEMVPYPTLELAKSDRFLCLFADPRDPGFDALARDLATLEDEPGLQLLLFPLKMKRDEVELVKDTLQAVRWSVPFAYPEASEVHARSLLGEIPGSAQALLVTGEGRLLYRAALPDRAALDALRTAAAKSP